MVEIPGSALDLHLSLNCGQVFHWRALPAHPTDPTDPSHPRAWIGLIDQQPMILAQHEGRLLAPKGLETVAARYLALDHPIAAWCASAPKDAFTQASLAHCQGLRILRQPAWECVATFITSALKQVPHITQISHTLRARYGNPINAWGTTLHTYPTPEALARVSENDLRDCKLGFRAKNLLGAAQAVADGLVNLKAIPAMDDEAAIAELCKLRGVGRKVAMCVLLFAYGRMNAFPIDVWIDRILRERYLTAEPDATVRRLEQFAAETFGPHGGYIQQCLFHYARQTWRKPKGK